MTDEAVTNLIKGGPHIAMSDEEFAALRALVYGRVGISLPERKRSLVVARLQGLLHEGQFTSYQQYYEHVVSDTTGRALDALVNRITTNYTYFYREPAHFEFLATTAFPALVADLGARHEREIRIWSAAASTGEEPYTLAMAALAFFERCGPTWQPSLLATDVDRSALDTARAGTYTSEQVGRLPEAWQQRYLGKAGDGQVTIRDEVQRRITFRRFNLINAQFPFKRPFHIIFCRNVMIYFDQPVRRDLVARLYEFTQPGGYLVISHSETLEAGTSRYRRVRPSIYRRDK